jgi:ABC-type transporter lipoprotein component MlaA
MTAGRAPGGGGGTSVNRRMGLRARRALIALLLVGVCTAGEAHASVEGYNRAMLGFNRWMLRWVFEPVARGYNVVVPKWGQRRVTAFFANLEAPRDILNSTLQGKLRRARTHTGRLLMNSTVGVVGFFDVAGQWLSWEARPETLDETLGVWGVPLGSYLVIPILGDSSPRAFLGYVGDGFMNPAGYFFFPWLGIGTYTLRAENLLATQMPTPWESEAEWDRYRRSRFDYPLYEIGREQFIADEADRVAE